MPGVGISERLYGTTHLRVVSCLSNLAPVLLALKEMDAVNQDYQTALKIRKAALGSWHSDAATSLNNLALVEAALGDPEKCRSVSYP